jgi:XRE family transcriptional regulator, regulator of sulfur utilization
MGDRDPMTEPHEPHEATQPHSETSQDSDFDEAQLGARIRALRLKQNLSLRAVAAKTGVSVSFLSQVERGTASPSIATLMRIARSLDRTIGSLFARDSSARLVRKGEGPRLIHPNHAWAEALLTPREFIRLEVIRSTLAPHVSTGDEYLQYGSGETTMIIESGEAHVSTEGYGDFAMYPGDCFSYDPTVPHRIWNETSEPCEIIFVSSPPSY